MYKALFLSAIILFASCSKDTALQPPHNMVTFKMIEGVLTADNRTMNLYVLIMPVDFEYVDHFHVWSNIDDQIVHPKYSTLKYNRRMITFSKTMYISDGCFYEIMLFIGNADQGAID